MDESRIPFDLELPKELLESVDPDFRQEVFTLLLKRMRTRQSEGFSDNYIRGDLIGYATYLTRVISDILNSLLEQAKIS